LYNRNKFKPIQRKNYMAEEVQPNYSGQMFTEANIKIRDLEEKQRILKDRLLLIGNNLVDIKEKVNKDNLEIKKELEILKQTITRVKSFLESASKEFSKFAKKEDLEILSKQAKMFQI